MDRIRKAVRAGALGPGVLVGALILGAGPVVPAAAAPPPAGYLTRVLGVDPSPTGNPVNRSGTVAGSVSLPYTHPPSSYAATYSTLTPTGQSIPDPLGIVDAATDVNRWGVVSGWSRQTDGGGPQLAWVWRPGATKRQVLGPPTDDVGSSANAVSDSGVVAGFQSRRGDAFTPLARTWDTAVTPAREQQLGTLGGSRSEALSINDAGYVVGSSTNARGFTRPFLWLPELKTMTDLGTLPGYDSGVARDINDGSHIVGEMFNRADPSQTQAFEWSPVTHRLTALGPSGVRSKAYAVNYHGLVVGVAEDHAVIWKSCHTPVIELPGTAALGINRTEHIVGSTPFVDDGSYAVAGAWFVRAGPCG